MEINRPDTEDKDIYQDIYLISLSYGCENYTVGTYEHA